MEERDGKQGVRAPSRSPAARHLRRTRASQRNRIGSCLDFDWVVLSDIPLIPCHAFGTTVYHPLL